MAPKLCDPGFLGGSSSSRSFLDVLANSSFDTDFPELRVSSFRGLPSLWISKQEIQALAVPFQFSLVGFFPSKQPSLDSIRRFFFNLKLNGEFLVTLLDSSHILIKLANDLDYCRVFCHRSYLVYNCYMKLTKWSPLNDIGVESPVISIWVSFPLLRPHLFSPRILYGLGSLFGKHLKIDSATSIGSRPSEARVLVELDITKSYPDNVWLGPEKSGYVQQVVLEEFRPFCASCKCIVHVVGSYHPQVDLSIPIKDSFKVSDNPALIISSPPLSVPSASPVVNLVNAGPILPVAEVLDVVNDQVVADLAYNSANVVTEDLDVGCAVINSANVCSSALASEGLVVENAAGVGNVCDGSSNVSMSVAGNRGDPVLGVVAAGDNENICATVDGLVEPILVNCDDAHLSSPLAVVPVVPEVAALSSDKLGSCKVTLGQSGLPPPANLEGKADIVNIPIYVVSNDELKSRMSWSMNNYVLVQSNWLDIDESISTPSTEDSENFGVHFNDDKYSFMVGCVVDQAVLNGGGKK
ncbi:hypothetical protein M5K25_014580 [Dendrobium thyrsiflorum]|uniref:DUF4283 domain-containing protein n=1 Tax=Dendrobium thyrsiflorum TaxID=117978 RepID=A0ABD0UN50_DENTH